MTISYLCIVIAGFLPYVFTGIVKISSGTYGRRANSDPRLWQTNLSDWRKRLHNAHLNGFEAFPFFAAGVLVAHQAGVAQGRIDLLAVIFVVARILYGWCYAKDWGMPRSLVWSVGFLCSLGLYVLAL